MVSAGAGQCGELSWSIGGPDRRLNRGWYHPVRDPDRLPPPPFWRTRYFAFDVLPRRPYLDMLEIVRIIARPERRVMQRDGRIRLYGYASSLDAYLRIVLLPDGETVHNAFTDEDYRP